VADLLEEARSQDDPDLMLRITLTGGLSEVGGAALWVRTARLPTPSHREGARVTIGDWQVDLGEQLARHKTLNYWARRRAYESARRLGFDEVVSLGPGSTLWEGSRSNLFVVKEDTLFTPTIVGPIVPGILRGLVLETARFLAIDVADDQVLLSLNGLEDAEEVFLTNAVRGILPVTRVVTTQEVGARTIDWKVPGPWTQRFAILVSDLLRGGGLPS
jgi:branched-subunit amino acid aminotransferase/4-amino-4-deoxychorismate lyase